MKGRILVLGAAGRLGAVAAETFRDAGWQVKGLVRPGRSGAVPRRVEAIEAVTRDEAVAAAQGYDVVLNAFNPVITEWQKNALSLAYAAIAAAEGNRTRPPHLSGAARRRARMGLPARFRGDLGAARRAARNLQRLRDLRISRPCGDGAGVHRHHRSRDQKQVHATADELVDDQDL